MRVLLAMTICGVMPAWAGAQTAAATIPSNDIAVSIGWAGAEHGIQDQRRWQGSVLAGLSAGHHWTDHLKTEVEASWSAPGTQDVFETIERQGGYTYALSEYRAQDIRVGVAQVYQLGRNEWVHPYVAVGADLVRRETSFDRLPQSRTVFLQNRNVAVDIPARSERRTIVFAQAVVKSGLKMYVGDKTFFNTELRFGVRRDVDHLVWRLGMGVDF